MATVVNLFGYDISIMNMMIFVALFGILFLFYRIQAQEKLDFADLITKDGRTVSLTKVLQLVGGITATWIVVKLTGEGKLNEGIFGVYLAYVGAIEGYSKYVAAKYKYQETSIRDSWMRNDGGYDNGGYSQYRRPYDPSFDPTRGPAQTPSDAELDATLEQNSRSR